MRAGELGYTSKISSSHGWITHSLASLCAFSPTSFFVIAIILKLLYLFEEKKRIYDCEILFREFIRSNKLKLSYLIIYTVK
jgi:hypothetical protein